MTPTAMTAVILFLIAAISTLYVVVGYPVLLAFLARHFPKPICKQDHQER